MIARRYDKAFFLRVDPQTGSQLEQEYNVTSENDYPKVILFRHFEVNHVVFKRNGLLGI